MMKRKNANLSKEVTYTCDNDNKCTNNNIIDTLKAEIYDRLSQLENFAANNESINIDEE